METYSPDLLWLVVISFIVAFILSFGIGANDVANSFGTSVGSKVLSLKWACILATIFEIAGAVLIGYKVSDTLRKVLIDVNMYQDSEKLLILGYLSSLGGSAAWLLIATSLRLPISGTHSIIGATVGFSLIAKGFKGLQWSTLLGIIASWFISPLLSGLISVLVYMFIRHYILKSTRSIDRGLQSLPIFYGLTIGINVFSVIEGGSKLLNVEDVPLWRCLIFSVLSGCISAVIVYIFVVPEQQIKLNCLPSTVKLGYENNKLLEVKVNEPITPINNSPIKHVIDNSEINVNKISNKATNNVSMEKNSANYLNNFQRNACDKPKGLVSNVSAVPLIYSDSTVSMDNAVKTDDHKKTVSQNDRPPVETIFMFLQILTAIFGSFAHGGNDVSNAIGPLVAIWLIYSGGSVLQTSETPFFILLYGGIGISVGLCVWGRNVIKTVGEDLTKITPSTGFSIELGSSMTVLLASKLGIPISTTHCKVGSVVFVGWLSTTKEGVDWRLFKNIIFAWIITLPVSAILSASLMCALTSYFL